MSKINNKDKAAKVRTIKVVDSGNDGNTYEHKCLLFFTGLYTFLFSGAVLGWGPMQLMLEENGSFHSLCRNDIDADNKVCPEQTARLITVQTTSNVLFFITPLLGFLVDRYGSILLMNIMAISGISGIVLLILVAYTGVDELLFLAFIGLGIVAISTNIMIVETSFELQGKLRTRSITALNALFDAGSITYLALMELKNALSLSFGTMVTGYLVTGLISFGGAVHYWKVIKAKKNELPTLEDGITKVESNSANEEVQIYSAGVEVISNEQTKSDTSSENDELEKEAKIVRVETHEITDNSEPSDTDEEVGPKLEKEAKIVQVETHEITNNSELSDTNEGVGPRLVLRNGYIPISSRTSRQQLCSKLFLALTVYYSFYLSRNLFVLATARDFLGQLGDNDQGNKYLTIFSLLLPASLIAVPFVNYEIENYGYHAAFQHVNILAFIHGVIQVYSQSLSVQVVGFVSFTFFRCFFFAVVFNFLPSFVSRDNIGKGAGILNFAGGIVLFCNIPLVNLAVLVYDSFLIPNLLYTVPIFISFGWVYKMCKWAAYDKKARKRLQLAGNN